MTDLPAISGPLPWQAELWAHLVQRVARDQLPHALLLGGVRHTGKSQLALALARLLLCHEPDDGHNCGRCHACNLSRAGSHGDFRYLEPAPKSRVIKIEQIRQVVEFANMTASLGRRKVVVLAPADAMNANAANAFLKVLEEPSADTHMILVCDRLQGLPATVRSRCQLLIMPLPSREHSLTWLDPITGSRQHSEALMTLADNRPLLAEQFYKEASIEDAKTRRGVLEALSRGQISGQQLAAALVNLSFDDALGEITGQLQRNIRAMDRGQLSSRRSRSLFELLDRVGNLQRAVENGANPNRQLIMDTVAAQFHLQLGNA
ncbi:MAG: hypothetical protein HOC23_02470 [Halieaceae bacterium]|nr:hypothetical protein [Halieaceae bacterium]